MLHAVIFRSLEALFTHVNALMLFRNVGVVGENVLEINCIFVTIGLILIDLLMLIAVELCPANVC